MDRRSMLKAAAAAPLAAAAARAGEAAQEAAPERKRRDLRGMNVLLFITDQQRAIQHFPPGWEEANLPGVTRLKRHGLTFERAFCNACMCSPSRATLMTGFFPAQHGVKDTLEADMPRAQFPSQVPLPLALPNLGTVMAGAGYVTPYKGKWHLSKPAAINTDPASDPPCRPNEGWVPEDVNRYGFQRWNPQDAGANQDVCQAAGGIVDNDGRFMTDDGDPAAGREGVLPYLRSAARLQQPFFLTVSLVNPHDVLAYPSTFDAFGYDRAWLKSTGITLPQTVDEDLSTKPTVQRQFRLITSLFAPRTKEQQQNYLNFYGNLMRDSDRYLVQILDTLEEQGLLDNTLIVATSDHGEMGMTHGGQIQKNFNVYEETLRVPLVFSNPRLYKKPKTTQALVSHVDFLPTMAALCGGSRGATPPWQGRDYSKVVLNPDAAGPQEYVVFTYDDVYSGQATGPYPQPPNRIASLRETRYKLARYYDAAGVEPDQWEMYDLLADPLEQRNLAFPGHRRTPEQERAYKRLRKELFAVERTRLQPLA